MGRSSRRDFLKWSAFLAAGAALPATGFASTNAPLYKISLAEWSLHRSLFAKKVEHLDFAKIAKTEFGIEAIEYVNQFFKDKAKDQAYLSEMKKRAEDNGVKSLLIMCDGEGHLGDADEAKRTQAIDNHKKWIDAALFLGCHSIRVNAASQGTYEEQIGRAADGLARLTEIAEKSNLSVIVENHGGLSSNGAWLSSVMKKVNHPHCGTLPDFGNFRVSLTEMYDRYKGVEELMPFAHAVSAKSHEFDEQGNEKDTDYRKMMKIVIDAGYRGFVGIEYEGKNPDEYAGIRATQKLLETVRGEMEKKV